MTEPASPELHTEKRPRVFRGIDKKEEAARAVRALRQALDEAYTRLHPEKIEEPDEEATT